VQVERQQRDGEQALNQPADAVDRRVPDELLDLAG